MATVILIRGNSGSGKTIVANQLHQILGAGTLLISQDDVRRKMLKVKDKPMNLAIGLIETMINYGIANCEYTIVEGILADNKYGVMLRKTLKKADTVCAYYYDIPYEETAKRHHMKEYTDFDETSLRSWFVPHDFIKMKEEKKITAEVSQDEMVQLILADLNRGVNQI